MKLRFSRRKRDSAKGPPEQSADGVVTTENFDLLLRSYLNRESMDPQKAMNVAAYASGVEFIAGVVSSLPIGLYKRSGDSIHELRDDRRVMLLNHSTGDLVRSHEMMRLFVKDYYNQKGGFIFVDRRGTEVQGLYYVDPRVVGVEIDETDHIHKRAFFTVDGRRYFPWQFIYAARNATNGVRGTSLIEQSADVLNTAYKTQVFEEALMARGGNRRGYLQSERKVNNETINNLKAAFRRMYQAENSDDVVVLNEGIKFQEASETSQEMQLAENKERQFNDVMSLFLIPPSLIQGGSSTDDHKKFVNYALMPLLAIIEDALNDALLLEDEKQDHYFQFDIKELTKADLRDRWTAWATAKKNGLVNADEFRRFENMEPLGMNYINLGLQDVLMDPDTKEIIVPNMGTIISPDDLQPARAPREPNAPVSNDPTDQTQDDNAAPDDDKDDRDPRGGDESDGDQS